MSANGPIPINFRQNYNNATPTVAPAKYVFTDSVMNFIDSLSYLAKFSDSLHLEFGERRIYAEAYTVTKSANVNLCFKDDVIAEWDYGDLGNIPDKRVMLSMKLVMGATRYVNKHDILTLSFFGLNCDKVEFCYKNAHDVERFFQIRAREVPSTFHKIDLPRHMFRNQMVIPCEYFDKLFAHMNETDELCLAFYRDRVMLTKRVTQSQQDNVALLTIELNIETFVAYTVPAPMSLAVYVKELKTSLKLMRIHKHEAHIYFDPDRRFLITYDDDGCNIKCKSFLSTADIRTLDEEDEEEEVREEEVQEREVDERESQQPQREKRARRTSSNENYSDDYFNDEPPYQRPPSKRRTMIASNDSCLVDYGYDDVPIRAPGATVQRSSPRLIASRLQRPSSNITFNGVSRSMSSLQRSHQPVARTQTGRQPLSNDGISPSMSALQSSNQPRTQTRRQPLSNDEISPSISALQPSYQPRTQTPRHPLSNDGIFPSLQPSSQQRRQIPRQPLSHSRSSFQHMGSNHTPEYPISNDMVPDSIPEEQLSPQDLNATPPLPPHEPDDPFYYGMQLLGLESQISNPEAPNEDDYRDVPKENSNAVVPQTQLQVQRSWL